MKSVKDLIQESIDHNWSSGYIDHTTLAAEMTAKLAYLQGLFDARKETTEESSSI